MKIIFGMVEAIGGWLVGSYFLFKVWFPMLKSITGLQPNNLYIGILVPLVFWTIGWIVIFGIMWILEWCNSY